MNRILPTHVLAVWIAGSLLGAARAELPADTKLDLYLLIGQSNMAGRGVMADEDRRPVERIWKLDKRDCWVPAAHPLHFDKPRIAGVGLGLSFAQQMSQRSGGREIGLIPCAVGGTPLKRWEKGGDLYAEAIRRAKIAAKHGDLKGVLWHQGEGDSGNASLANSYAQRLDRMIANLRAEFDKPDLPFVAGGLLDSWVDSGGSPRKTVQTALRELPKRVPHTAFADSDGLEAKPDGIHFNAKSLHDFGRRYATEMLRLQNSKSGHSPRREAVATESAAAATPSKQPVAEKPPHVVIVFADDMGYGDAGCYNPESKIPTPHIDRLAQEGMRFTDAHAADSVCVPSRYALLAGEYPFRRHLGWKINSPKLRDGQVALATLLRSAGYRTACVGKWHLGFACDHPTRDGQPMPGGPGRWGFDQSLVIWASLDIPPYYYIENDHCVAAPTEHIGANHTEGWRDIQGAFWREGSVAPGFEMDKVLPTFTAKAVEYIDHHATQANGKPLFLYYALPAPHTPWVPADPFRGRSGAGLYGDYVFQVDAALGQVIAALEKQQMLDDTLLVFTSDNGPVWFDEDVERFGHRSSGPLRGIKGDLWEGGHRMPLVVRWNGKVPAGATSDALVGLVDVLATMAELVGQQLPEDAQLDSISFLPVLLGQSRKGNRKTLLHTRGNTVAVRHGPWKFIPGLGSFGFSAPRRGKPQPGGPRGQLYHLGNDLAEQNNLWLQEPEVVERLEKMLPKKRR